MRPNIKNLLNYLSKKWGKSQHAWLGSVTPVEGRTRHPKKTQVIILSADAMPEPIAELLALAGGARAYLTKPIDIQEFLNVVTESLAEIPRSAGSPINLEEE